MAEAETLAPVATREPPPVKVKPEAGGEVQTPQAPTVDELIQTAPPELAEAFYKKLPEDKRRELAKADVEREAKRQAERTDSEIRLKADRESLLDELAGETDRILKSYVDVDGTDRLQADLVGYGDKVRDNAAKVALRELRYNAAQHSVWSELTEDDHRKFASVDGQPHDVASRVWLHTLLDRAVAIGESHAAPKAEQAAQQQADTAQWWTKFAEAVGAAKGEIPSTQIRSLGSRWEAFQSLPIEEQAKVPESERREIYREHTEALRRV